jgi:hypothetical protein
MKNLTEDESDQIEIEGAEIVSIVCGILGYSTAVGGD